MADVPERARVAYERLEAPERHPNGAGERFSADAWRIPRLARARAHAGVEEFQAAFPSLPLAGFWAGGEIGPQALVEAALEQATRTGRATLQGFTAVFGIFRAPLPAARSWLAALGDEGVPAAVGEVLARRRRPTLGIHTLRRYLHRVCFRPPRLEHTR